jgi:hypothetical protein
MDHPPTRRRSRHPGSDIQVVAHDRAYEAHQLRLTGLDWKAIAERVGYLDGKVAATAVNAYLQKVALEQAPEHRRHALDLELGRLDQLQAAFYPNALAGDVIAANFVLKVIARRCAVLGFDKPDDDAGATARTIVVAGSEQEYIAALQRAAQGTNGGGLQ